MFQLTLLTIFFRLTYGSRLTECDIVVAGGTTAAVAAATNAARSAPHLTVCLTEPTDWLGGQLTAGGVSAIDYGPCNSDPVYQPPDWRDLVDSLGNGDNDCWVSITCFMPHILIGGWMDRVQDELPNLHVYYNTVVRNVTTSGRRITSVGAVTRTARPGADQWGYTLSETLDDWYSVDDSAIFTKQTVEFVAKEAGDLVVIDSTLFGDVLVMANASYRQGIEVPEEESPDTDDGCGQALTYPFYVVYNYEPVSRDDNMVNLTEDDFSLNGFTWGCVWAYRRSVGFTHANHSAAKLGEVSNQNWGTDGGNDYLDGYVLLPYEQTKAQASDGRWRGGVNITTLSEGERRAREYYTWFKSQAPDSYRDYLSLGPRSIVGTTTGLSKVPYLRDTRRSVGLDGFRLLKRHMSEEVTVFEDRVALGHYLYADTHPLRSCEAPEYLADNDIEPYYIPFRALTNRDFDNLLVAGLTMAQTYFANAGTRLQPEEWGTGLAAGLAATVMVDSGYTSRDMYEDVGRLQDVIRTLMPLDWGDVSDCRNSRLLADVC